MKKKIVFLIVVLSILIISLMLSSCLGNSAKNIETLEVMLPKGEGYSVTSDHVVAVKRGDNANFSITILEGYTFCSANIGTFDGSVFTVNNVMYSMTVHLDVKLKAKIQLNHPNANLELVSLDIDDPNKHVFIPGEKARITLTANENYNVESILVNDQELKIEIIDYRHAVSDITIEENMVIDGVVLGDPYSLEIRTDKTLGDYELVSSTIQDNIPRYGDVIVLSAIPKDHTIRLGYFNYEGVRFENTPLTITITSDTLVEIVFQDASFIHIGYNPNGGRIVEGTLPPMFFKLGTFENIDHCNDKIVRNGYTLVGLREGLDGEIHSLGALIRIPKVDIELYAVWEKWSSAEIFEYGGLEEITITGIKSSKVTPKIVVPAMIDGKNVTEIAANVFSNNAIIEEIVFNNNLLKIGDSCFYNMPKLKKVVLFDSIRYMGTLNQNAFMGSNQFSQLTINATTRRFYENVLETSYADKHLKLKATKEDDISRIITVSGCSIPRGINSPTIREDEVLGKYEVIHMGIHAGYSLQHLLITIKNHIKAGDIVIFAPEYYGYMFNEAYVAQNRIWEYVEANYDILKDFDMSNTFEKNNLLKTLSQFMLTRKTNIDDNIYTNPSENRKTINQYGDFNYFRKTATSEADLVYGWDAVNPTSSLIGSGIDDINNLVSLLPSGTKPYFSFTPVYRTSDFDTSLRVNQRASFMSALRDRLSPNIPIIGDVDTFAYELKCFSNSINHASTEFGVPRYTQSFIQALKAQLAKEGVSL